MRAHWISAIAVLVIGAGSAGCAAKIPEEAASSENMTERRYSALMRLASTEIECPSEDLSYSYLEDNRHALTGCGRSAEYILICQGTQCRWAPPPMAQASFDLDCAIDELELVPIHDQKVGIRGCGRRASYGWICQSVLSCDWYRDGIDGVKSEAAATARKASKQRAIEASNVARRQTRALESARNQSSQQSTLQNATSAAANAR